MKISTLVLSIKIFLFFFLFYFLPSNLYAREQIETIPPVIVKVPEKKISLTSGPTTIITHQEIFDAGVTNLSQTLQSLTNLRLTSITGTDSQVLMSIRGFGANASSNTLLLIDGIPLTNPDLAPPDFNSIPINEIKSIEIIEGSEGVLYGDQAVGGIVNIITRNHLNDASTLSCHTGSYQQYGCLSTFNHYQKSIGLLTNLTLFTQHTNNYRAHNDDDKHQLLGRFNLQRSMYQLNFNYQFAFEKMQYPGALTRFQVKQNRRQATNHTDFFKDWHGLFHLHYQQFLSAHAKFKADISYRLMNGAGVLFSSFNQSRTCIFVKPQLQTIIGDSLIATGIDLQFDQYQLRSAFGLTNEYQQQLGIFALATIPIRSLFTLSIGARGEEEVSHLRTTSANNYLNRAIANTLGFTYRLTNDAHLYLRRAQSFRLPKADENAFSSNIAKGLRTERSISYETGIEIERSHYSVKFNIYELYLHDEIAFDPTKTEFEPFGSNRNLTKTKRQGFNLATKYKVLENLDLLAQYDLVDARFACGSTINKRIPLVPMHNFNASLLYQMNPHLSFYIGALYTGNQYAANDDKNVAGKIGGYFLYHFNIRYEHKPFSASFRVNNIFDKKYYLYTVLQQSIKYFYPAPERNFILTLNYEMC